MNFHLPPESAGVILVVKMCAMVHQGKEPGTILAKFDQFVQKMYKKQDEIVHKILGRQFQHQLDVLRLLTREALCHRDIEKWFTADGFRSLFALIGTNGQGICSSSILTWVINCEKLDLDETERASL